MQAGYVKIGNFGQITWYNLKMLTVARVVNLVLCVAWVRQ